jgi:hypothetical protein
VEENDGALIVKLAFFEFTTGTPHPLSLPPTLVLPSLSGFFDDLAIDAQVLGDHVLVLVSDLTKTVIYVVSWKTGIVTPVSHLR